MRPPCHQKYEATTLIQKEAHEDATVIWGRVVDKAMKEEIRVTVIATGFGKKEEKRASPFKKVAPISFGLREQNKDIPHFSFSNKENNRDIPPRWSVPRARRCRRW